MAEVKQKQRKKLKLLVYADWGCSSGFAQVAENIIGRLHKTGKYEITVFGINYYIRHDQWGGAIDSGYPFKVIPARVEQDLYGRDKFLKYVNEEDFDILWVLQDPFIANFLTDEKIVKKISTLHQEKYKNKKINYKTLNGLKEDGKKFVSIFYHPIDCDDPRKYWIEEALSFDVPVPYTSFAEKIEKKAFPEKELNHILHGIDSSVFFPLSKEQKEKHRKEILGDRFNKKTFIVLYVARNQPRKDIPRAMKAFSLFAEKVPNSLFYLHCSQRDVGGNLANVTQNYPSLIPGKNIVFTDMPTNHNLGIPKEHLNIIYNIADLYITTNLGEGFGLPTLEAMAAKIPVIVPRHTSHIEIIGENEERGLFCEAGTTTSEYTVISGGEDEVERKLVNVDSLVEKMIFSYNHKKHLHDKVENAYEYAKSLDWDNIVTNKWFPLFKKVEEKLAKMGK